MSLTLFLCGTRTLRVPRAHCTAVMNLCMQMGISYRNFVWEENAICFQCSMRAAGRLMRACRRRDIEIVCLSMQGLPSLLFAFCRRPGLVAGSILGIVLTVLSGLFVWSVDVTGNETMSKEEVLSVLQECDFGVGSYLPTLQIRKLENRVLMASDRIGWISIYLDGTVARVQIIEHKDPDAPMEDRKLPANLVAASDGQIEYVELYRGNCVVQVGQAVKKGELLVSGLYDSQTEGFRYTRAAGNVMARTEHTYRVEIPLVGEEKVLGEVETDEIILHFFNFSMKIFKNSRNLPPTCDIIKNEIELPNFGKNSLPLSVTQICYQPYAMKAVYRTEEEALVLCYEELERTLAVLSESAQLLSKEIKTEITQESVILVCTVGCIENIAVLQEFEIIE